MRHVTLRQLGVFEEVARLGSISAAAGVCHLTQPAVSMQIKALEEACGLPLTELVGRKLRLTTAGEVVAAHARRTRQVLSDLEQALASMRGKHAGRLDVGIVSTAKYFASHLLAAFLREQPGITLTLKVENRADILRLLADNEIDLAIMGVPPASIDSVALAFAPHPHGLVLPAAHPLAGRRRLDLADLADEPFLVRETGSGTRTVMERYFASRSFSPPHVIQMTGNEAIKQAVMAGLGVGFLSLHTVILERRLGLVVVPRLPGLPVVRRWHVVHRRGKQLMPIAMAFRDFVAAHGTKFAGASGPAGTSAPVAPARKAGTGRARAARR